MSNEVLTTLYFVRHAESEYVEGLERERGLTEQGKHDAETVSCLLLDESINLFYSSPYKRALDTVQGLADQVGAEIVTNEDLRERALSSSNVRHTNFQSAKRKLYEDRSFAFPGGESSIQAQQRAVQAISDILERHSGQKIVIGTHGDVMTLIFNYYDESYDYGFWGSTSMPDIYKLEFNENHKLMHVSRLWEPNT
ncbi:histidine phosphatase family protein [Paenibacillus tundrae]|uniref:histidine phosphatase family protein n=1 Tax=Paenibacillus tundrae TaxID=528187 RepID=UPI0030CAB46A